MIFRGRVASCVTEKKEKTGFFEHKRERNSDF